MTAASYVFYSFWDVRFSVLLLGSSIVDFVIAQQLGATEDPRSRKRWLVASVAFNLGLLAVFKYAILARDTAQSLIGFLGSEATLPLIHIVLPVGISFYTFQTMSYTIDVYRREVEPTKELWKYLAYVSLFPQLVAGPIVRYKEVDEQFQEWPRWPSRTLLVTGVTLFSIGLGKKIIVADPIARFIDPLWVLGDGLRPIDAWFATVGYTFQLYFDFSGYSDMAIGLGLLLGLRYPKNFDAPYQATDPSDFWRRWHISLSTWLRDYLYIPLGGNKGSRYDTYTNLFIVMLLGGLWHGAAYTFVFWGAFHGLILMVHRANRSWYDRLPVTIRRTTMLLVVMMGWVLFRAEDMTAAREMYAALFAFGSLAWDPELAWEFLWFAAILVITQVFRPLTIDRFKAQPWYAALAAALLVLSLIMLRAGPEVPFLYYQF